MLARSLLTNTGRRLYQLKLIATMELLAIFVTIHYPKKEKKISQRWLVTAMTAMKGYQIALPFDLQKVRVTSPHFVDRECWET